MNGGGYESAAVSVMSWFLGFHHPVRHVDRRSDQRALPLRCGPGRRICSEKDTVSNDCNLYCMTAIDTGVEPDVVLAKPESFYVLPRRPSI